MLVYYLQMLDTPEEKMRFEQIYAGIGWAAFYIVPSHGSEMYGIIALLITSAAVGALLTGLITHLKRADSIW